MEGSQLYVGGQTILSQKGTTQGDPLAMPMYAIGIIPLIRRLKEAGSRQVWYADDATGAGTLEQVNRWWTQLNEQGPAFGYFPNAEKTWLLVKDHKREEAIKLFAGSGVSITSDGRRLLGSVIGTNNFKENLIGGTTSSIINQLGLLSQIAKNQPQAAYTV